MMNDLPKGYRWATAEETENLNSLPGAIVVKRTVDASGKPYTQDEADIAVPYSTKGRPNKNYILQLMRDGDMGDPFGNAMAWAFAVAETLNVLGAEVPPELGYQPSPFVRVETPDTYEPESYEDECVWEFLTDQGVSEFPDTVSEVWDADMSARISEVQQAGKILHRYIEWCRLAGRDY